MFILGINCAYHESSACLLHDGQIVLAVEEERLNRIKHAKPARIDNPHQLPLYSIACCFKKAGIGWKDIAHVGVSLDPSKRLNNIYPHEPKEEHGWGSPSGEKLFYENICGIPEQLNYLGFRGQFQWLDHQLCHAASSFYSSPFENAAILTLDGIGESSASILAQGHGHRLDILDEIPYPASLGFLWEKISLFLGFDEYDACKVMGLAAYGDPARYLSCFQEVVHLTETYVMDANRLCFRVPDHRCLETLFGMARRRPVQDLQQEHSDLAAALQEITNQVVLHLVRQLAKRCDSNNLCLSGGVALNCVSNRHALEKGPFQNLFIPSATHDAGTAIGASFLIQKKLNRGEQKFFIDQAYLGPEFTDEELRRALEEKGVVYSRETHIEATAASLLEKGNIIGWFQGRMETGPRALGNRSLLADPRNPDVRSILNLKVKHRELFRPFAPSILHENASEWFEIEKPALASDYMLLAYPVRPEKRCLIPAVIHEDGTSRVQTVKKGANPRFHRLLSEFNKQTGVPLLLNTSFNDGEPIVCTPQDAVHTFLKTGIDYLVMGNFLAGK